MDGNAFATSLQQLGQWLQQQNQGTGSGSGSVLDAGFNLGSGQQPSKVITQVHYAQPQTSTNDPNAQPAVTTAPAAPQVSSFAPPQGSAQAVPQPNAVNMPSPEAASTPRQGGIAGGGGGGDGSAASLNAAEVASGGVAGDTSTLGDAAGAAGGGKTGVSNAISGITSALAKGFSNAGQAIGNVKTMPTPIQSGPFPGINQQTPSLIGRRTQPAY